LPGAARVLEQSRADLALDRSRERDQPLAAFGEPALPHLSPAAVLVLQPRARQELRELQIAGARLGEQQQPVGFVALGFVADPDIAADDRLHADGTRRLVEFDHAEDVGEVGDRQRRHAVRRRALDGLVDAHDPVGDGELAVEPKVDEGGIRHQLEADSRRKILPPGSGRERHRSGAIQLFLEQSTIPSETSEAQENFMTAIKGIVALVLATYMAAAAAETVVQVRAP